MTILAAFYKTISDSPNPNLTQEFDYERALSSLEKTFKKFNPKGKFILATDMVTNIKLDSGKAFRTELGSCNIMESLVLSNLDLIKQLEGKIILCGADHLITGNLNNFFKEDFDIGILWSGGKVNNTVVLANTELGNKEKIVSFFQERTDAFYELDLLEKSWLGDQISIQSVLREKYQIPKLSPGESMLHESRGLKFKFFNYSEEFVFGVKKSSAGYSKTAIFLDFKGNSRKRWFTDIAQEVLNTVD
jgi:hypothetical protein